MLELLRHCLVQQMLREIVLEATTGLSDGWASGALGMHRGVARMDKATKGTRCG